MFQGLSPIHCHWRRFPNCIILLLFLPFLVASFLILLESGNSFLTAAECESKALNTAEEYELDSPRSTEKGEVQRAHMPTAVTSPSFPLTVIVVPLTVPVLLCFPCYAIYTVVS
jgi:hypothetical protein